MAPKIENNSLYQFTAPPARVTATSRSLIDHCYVCNKYSIMQPSLTVFGFSDQFPVCLTWLKRVKTPTSGNKTILGLSNSTILGVYNVSEPDAAPQHGHGAFVNVYDKRAPFKTTREK